MENLDDKFVKENVILKEGDKIILVLYHDHATTTETIKNLIKNPPLLWCAGKKLFEDMNRIIMITSGGLNYPHFPEVKYIVRSAIVREIHLLTFQGIP